MKYAPLTPRQTLAMLWWSTDAYRHYDGIICDGAIRSGKTVMMSVGFIMWALHTYDGQHFAICGKTVESLRRNIILPLREWLPQEYEITERRTSNLLIITHGQTVGFFHLFGGRDESSYMLIQGMTLAGVLLDEVVLMPQSFVEQAVARCSVLGSKYWFNCNPGSPQHWFYLEWVKKSKQKNILRLHFTMHDNGGLDARIRERYERQYSGVFYRRYILGEWCTAEGLIYTQFDKERHVLPRTTTAKGGRWYVSIDYGTHNPFAALLWNIGEDGRARCIDEYYHSGRDTQKEYTPEEYYQRVEKFIGKRPIEAIVIDPAASEFITTVRKHGKYNVRKGNNAVMAGIQCTQSALLGGYIAFSERCKGLLREIQLYSWDEKRNEDAPIKKDDHAMDAMRYFVYTILRRKSYQFKQYIAETGGIDEDD